MSARSTATSPSRADGRPAPQESAGESRWSRVLLAIQVASLLSLVLLLATRYWQDHIWSGWALLAVATAAWLPELGRPRARRLWFAYVGGIFAYALVRSYADDAGMAVRFTYVIDAEKTLFFGTVPNVWLQDRFFSPPEAAWHDWLAVQVHWSFFIAPHLAAVLVFLFRRPLFARYAVLMLATMYAGLALFFLAPTAPPWLASSMGYLPETWRIMDVVGGSVHGSAYQSLYASLGEPNSVAAMPSIHMAVTFAMYLWARDHYPRVAFALLAYSLVMGFALVYLAEHYVVDLAVGALLAIGAHLAVRRFVPVREPAPTAAPRADGG
jgi:membrane-associated phospholipid phosphatase